MRVNRRNLALSIVCGFPLKAPRRHESINRRPDFVFKQLCPHPLITFTVSIEDLLRCFGIPESMLKGEDSHNHSYAAAQMYECGMGRRIKVD